MSANLIPFTSDGGIISGGNITTAGYASPAPSITGFSSINAVDFNASGNLDIDGEASVGGNLTIVGNITFSGGGSITEVTSAYGNFFGNSDGSNALYAGVPGGVSVPGSISSFTGDSNAYMQINAQNQNHGTQASMEYVVTGDLGTDTTDYLDLGFASSTWDGTQDNSLGTAVAARDGYMYVQGGGGGGNLILGTTTAGRKIKFNAGGPNSANTVANISNLGIDTKAIYTDNYYYANGAPLAVPSGNTSVTTTGNVTAGNISTSGNLTAGALIGDGGNISNIRGGNVVGAVSYATTANSVAAANVSGLGNVALLSKDGNASNVLYGNGVFAGITAGTSLVNGNSNIVVNANSNVIIGANGNASVFDIGADGRVRMLNGPKIIGGNIVAGDGYLQFSGSTLTMFAGNVQLLGGGYIKGPAGINVIQLNSPENGSARINGNLAVGASNTGAIYAGTISTSGNANIGNIGTAGLITATGNINGGNLVTAGQVSATGNITTAGTFVGNGAGLTNVTVNAAGNIQGTSSNVSLVAGSYTYTFDNTGNFTMPANSDIVFSGNTSLSSLVGSNGNITINPDGTGQLIVTNITPAYFGNTVSIVGNASVGNVSASGNVTASYLLGNGSQLTGISVSSIANGTSNINIATSGGNVQIVSGGNIIANISGANFLVNSNLNVFAGRVYKYGGFTGTGWGAAGAGFIATSATYTDTSTAAGTQAASYVHNLSGGTLAFSNAVTVTTAAGLVASAPTAGTNATIGTSYAIISQGAFSATGNISTGGLITATGNITGANLATAGLITATGNITGGNLATAGLITATGNITGGNLVTGGAISATGNVTVSGSAGVITPNLPAFRVYGNGVTNVSTTTNTNGVLNGNNWLADYNQGGYLNSTTGTFTAPVAGLYQINLQMRVANNTAPTAQAIVQKNRGSSPTTQVMWESAANPTINHFGTATVAKLAAGDTLNLVVSVGNLTFDVNDNWSVAFLG